MEMTEAEVPALIPERVGDRLRAARINAGIDLSDLATRTRVPLRHLEALEGGNYAALPAPTYCVGFVKAYARAVGLDEVEMGREVRSELGIGGGEQTHEYVDYDAADPTRVPPRWLAWAAATVALLLIGGFFVVRSNWFTRGDSPAAVATQTEPGATPGVAPANATAPSAVPATGQVVLTMDEDVWLRIYDQNDKVIVEGVKKKGESIAVPPEITTAMIRTQLPHMISITVAGKAVPKLADKEKFIKDVGISAKALADRAAAPPPPTASTAPRPQ